ncbi:SET and MYND domain-containing protein 4 [Diretmus argenteus]
MKDLPRIQWQDHVAQKWMTLDPELKENFTSALGIDDVFKCALTQTTQEDLDFLQGLSNRHSVQKISEQAERWRERGNSSFKTRDYTDAALHYSQALCFAPQSSEQLPLCYANRSAALYHLQLYQESLDDIDRALNHGYPSHLQYKLQHRRTQCLSHLSVGQKGELDYHRPVSKDHKGPETVEKTNLKPPKTYIHDGTDPKCCVSPQVAVCFSPEKGRHLVVTERIAAGEVILKDRPYSCVLIPRMEEVEGKEKRETTEKVVFGTEDRHCHRCLCETMCPVPCQGCSYSRYCSGGCRREAWEEHHRWECPLGADLMVMGVMSQLALRVALKAGLKNVQMARETIRDKDSDPPPVTGSRPSCLNNDSVSSNDFSFHTNKAEPSALYYGDSYLSIYHLLHHLNRHSPGMRFLCAVTVAALYLKLSRAGPLPASWDLSGSSKTNSQSHNPDDEGETADWLWLLGSAVLRHMLQLRCNAQAVTMLQDTGASDSVVLSNQEIRIATAIFPTLSLLNHSCCPNTSLAFSAGANTELSGPDMSADFGEDVAEFNRAACCGVSVTVRAAKALTPGQEILHCYGPHSSRMMTRKRQRLLQGQYYFLCKCEACNLQEEEEEGSEGSWQGLGIGGRPNDAGLQCGKCKGPLKKCHKVTETGFTCSQPSCGQRMSYSEVRRRLQEVRDHLDKALDLMERDRPDEALRLLERTRSQSGLILTETHRLQGELADAMARAYATMGDWNSAASHLERSAAAIISQYGEDSIELGRQLFKLAQIHFNGGAIRPALSVILRVRRLLSLHCGPHCPELHELQAMEDCLRG